MAFQQSFTRPTLGYGGFCPPHQPYQTRKEPVPSIPYLHEETVSPPHAANDTCWLDLIDGANIGVYDDSDLPANVGSSSHDWVRKGLKIRFHILVHIAGIDDVVHVDGTPVLRGFQTALIPIEIFDDGSVQWHFLTRGDDERFRWLSDRHDFRQSRFTST